MPSQKYGGVSVPKFPDEFRGRGWLEYSRGNRETGSSIVDYFWIAGTKWFSVGCVTRARDGEPVASPGI